MESGSSSSIVASSSNTRALTIFVTCLTTDTALACLLVHSIVRALLNLKTSSESRLYARIAIFTALAVASLGVTWYYMLQFFVLSYRSWAFSHAVPLPKTTPYQSSSLLTWYNEINLGPWLKDVKLFRDAWETVMETPARLCWSQPIFVITTAWSFYIGQEASKRRIPHPWAYMVLGQLVAISFAMNLFHLAVLVHPVPHDVSADVQASSHAPKDPKRDGKSVDTKLSSLRTPPESAFSIFRYMTMLSILAVVGAPGSPYFMPLLTLVHVVLLLPPVMHLTIPRKYGVTHTNTHVYDRVHRDNIRLIALKGIIFELGAICYAIYSSMQASRHQHRHSNVYPYPWQDELVSSGETAFQSLWRSLLDHPAVSSVGWDSVLCTASLLVWQVVT